MKLLPLLLFSLLSINSFASFDQDHTKLNEILESYTKKTEFQTLVDYKNLKKNHGELKIYLNQLQDLTIKEFDTFTSDQKLAFWINAYNAYTLELIVTHYPVKSIKDIGNIFSGPWSKKIVKLFGKKMSLDNIEHDTIRKQFNEPRIHFAVNCASIGCPSLLREAFTADKLENQLVKSASNFLDNKNKNYLDGKTLFLSKIFDWYGDDFKKTYGSYQAFIKKHYGITNKVDVKFMDYDWDLNQY